MPSYTVEQTTTGNAPFAGQLDRTVVAVGNRDEWVQRVREVLEDANRQRKELDIEREQAIESFTTRQDAIDQVIGMCDAALGQINLPAPELPKAYYPSSKGQL